MMNIPKLQDQMRTLSDQQLQQVVVSPQQPIESTIALGLLSERQKLRSEQQSQAPQPMGSVAEQIMSQLAAQQQPMQPPMLPPQGVGQPPQMGMPPIRMQNGGSTEDAITQAIANAGRVQDAARGAFDPTTVPGYMPQFANFESSLDFLRQYMPDRYADIVRRQQEFDAGLSDRQAMDRNAALLALGSGLMSSRSPNFLSAVGDAGSGALPSFMSAMRRPEEEQLAALQRDMQMAGLQGQRDATLLSGGLEGYQSNAALAREGQANVAQAIQSEVDAIRAEQAAREAQANQLEYGRLMMGNNGAEDESGAPALGTLVNGLTRTETAITSLQTLLSNAPTSLRPDIQARIDGLEQQRQGFRRAIEIYYPQVFGSGDATPAAPSSGSASIPTPSLPSAPAPQALGDASGGYRVTRTPPDPNRAGPDQ